MTGKPNNLHNVSSLSISIHRYSIKEQNNIEPNLPFQERFSSISLDTLNSG